MVPVINLGAGGMLFYYNKFLKEGALMDLKISFSPVEDPVVCVGQVLRMEKMPTNNMCIVAVLFQEMGDGKRELVDRVVEQYHSQSLE